MSGSSMKIGSTSFHWTLPSCFHTPSLSTQYSNPPSSPTREGHQTLSPVSPSVSAVNHRGLCCGIFPSSLAFRVARCRSSCMFFSVFAISYLPFSNARWSGRSRLSVGQRYGRSVSLGQSFNVIANGVKLNGVTGFSEFRQSRMYSLDGEVGELGPLMETSGCRNPLPVPTGRATSWLFQRPAISYVTLPLASLTWPEISYASRPRQPLGLNVRTHWSLVRWFVIFSTKI
jgi:hypothetical protein